MTANDPAAIAGPEQCFPGLIRRDVGGVRSDIGQAKRDQFFVGTINTKRRDTVGTAQGDVQPFSIRADKLRAR